MSRRLQLIIIAIGFSLVAGEGVRGESDPYTAGFYTRGPDAAASVEQEGTSDSPFYVPVRSTAVLPRVTVTATREDNVFLSSQDEENSTSVAIAPGVLFYYGHPERNQLYLDLGALVPVYDDPDRLDEEPSLMAVIGGRAGTGLTRLSSRAGYRRVENADTVIGARIVKEDYIGGVGVERRLSTKTSAGIDGAYERHEFDAASYIDYERFYGAGQFSHRLTGKSSGYIQLGMGRDDLDTEGNMGDADFYDVSLGLRGRPSAKTSASGSVGYRWRQYDEAIMEDVNHWIAALQASASPFGLTRLTTELTADIRPSVETDDVTTVQQRLTVGADRRLFIERLRGSGSVFFGRTEYYGPEGRPARIQEENDLVYDGREDEYWGFDLGLDWWTREHLSMGLNYSYIERYGSQNASTEDQDRTSYESGRWVLRMSWNY